MSAIRKFLQQNPQLRNGSSKVYEKVLEDLSRFVGPKHDIDDLSEDDVMKFLERPAQKYDDAALNTAPKSAATFNLHLVILKAYFHFIGKHYFEKMSHKKTRAKSLDITTEHIMWLQQSCRNARDECLIAVLANYGLRIGEAAAVCLKHLEPHPSGTGYYITVPGEEGCKTGTRKVLNVACDAVIGNWLQKHPKSGNPEAQFFCNLNGEPMIRHYLQNTFLYIVQRARKAHPSMPHIHPHLLRHWCITQWNKVGLNTTTIQQLSGHRTLAMVEHYCHLTNADANAALERVAGIKTPEKQQPTAILCPKCKRNNLPGAVVCSFCASPMNLEIALEIEHDEKDILKKMLKMLREHPEIEALLPD